MEENKSSGGKATLILLALLLLASIAGNFYLYKTKNTNEVVIQEKVGVIDSLVEVRVSIENELNAALADLDNRVAENDEQAKEIDEQKELLIKRKNRIQNLIRSGMSKNKIIEALKLEKEGFEKEREEFLERIDELSNENEELKSEIVLKNITNDSLSGKLKSAGALKVEYVKVKSVRIRYNGKEKETSLARRAEKMEVCFSIMDNKVAKTGERTVYARIMQPDGVVLGEKGKFAVVGRGVETGYTGSETFSYDRSKKDFCFDFTDEKYKFQKGTYLIDIFINGELHTSGYYDLR